MQAPDDLLFEDEEGKLYFNNKVDESAEQDSSSFNKQTPKSRLEIDIKFTR